MLALAGTAKNHLCKRQWGFLPEDSVRPCPMGTRHPKITLSNPCPGTSPLEGPLLVTFSERVVLVLSCQALQLRTQLLISPERLSP